jgi:hypothetical protein
MTFERLREILLDMEIFKMRGSMSPPNNRVIFERKPLRIIVTPKESEVRYDHWLAWSFTLNGLTTKEFFVMLDDYFPQPDDEDVYPSWRDIDFGNAQDWINFKTKWLRHEKIDSMI